MKVVVLYRPDSEYSRAVDEFAREFTQRYPDKKIELISVDTRDGSATASLYDILRYPAVLALSDDGRVIQEWHEQRLPLISEVSYYAGA
ncbi:MAG: hypothetical protein WD885_02430 [Candidatus Saccharimonadales bacterium]